MIKNKVKVFRVGNNWTQADLASQLNISRQAVISIEKYKYLPSLELAFKIAKVFNSQIEEVFYEEEE
ncbi:Helix-turn-helix XRE-family transcriptional regulator [Paucilactobacillus oligofermentans DSM 15707 = LMG 22743]|nr:helix-turn-helix transcriptional regulator [Paucilactobacillus oligofermentans]CUS25846.1 Helix-turn-helix XRE-family transcriptional regulator [Paucilactobacillus oligofermentans DSM 15707 = LMG 22743]